MACKPPEVCASYVCLLHLSLIRYSGMMLMCLLEFEMILYGMRGKNVALNLSLVSHPLP